MAGGNAESVAYHGTGIDRMTESKKAGQAAIGIIGGSGLYDIEDWSEFGKCAFEPRSVRRQMPFVSGCWVASVLRFSPGMGGGTGSVPAASTIAPISMR